MSQYQVLGVIVAAGLAAVAGFVNASDVPEKKAEPSNVAPNSIAPSTPKSEAVEAKSKTTEPLKWDRLDPKALEQLAKKKQSTSPFSAVPAER